MRNAFGLILALLCSCAGYSALILTPVELSRISAQGYLWSQNTKHSEIWDEHSEVGRFMSSVPLDIQWMRVEFYRCEIIPLKQAQKRIILQGRVSDKFMVEQPFYAQILVAAVNESTTASSAQWEKVGHDQARTYSLRKRQLLETDKTGKFAVETILGPNDVVVFMAMGYDHYLYDMRQLRPPGR